MQNSDVILWLVLLAAIAAIGVFQVIENQRLTRKWERDLSTPLQQFLTRFAWSRTLQIAAVLVCYSVVIAFYNAKVSQLNRLTIDYSSRESAWTNSKQELEQRNSKLLESNNALTAQITSLNQQLSQQSSAIQLIAQQQQALNESVKSSAMLSQPASTAPLDTQEETGNDSEADQMTSEQPTIAPINQSSIEQIYNADSQPKTPQDKLDNLKKRYEDILVIHFFLKKCARVSAADYHVITSALAQEMASLNAPGRLQNDILTAAQGSYREMYSRSDCSAEGVAKLNEQYTSFINNLSLNYTAQ